MKHRNLTMRVLLGFILLLVGCGGANKTAKQTDPPEIPAPQEQGGFSVSGGVDVGALLPTLDEIEPTPSAQFEQSYLANSTSERDYSEYKIITLLPPDGIPALTNPSYYGVSGADKEYDPDEMVLGIEFNGDARAYSVGLLSSHEIVNDTVGGIHLAVTW